MVWHGDPNQTKIINKINTKLNDLFCSAALGDTSFWARTIANVLLYILCRNTGPRMFISLTMWTRRCIIILENESGKTITKLTRHWTTSFYGHMSLFGSIIFCEISSRKAHSFTSANLTFSGRISLSSTGSNYVIRMWQSRDFKFVNFSFILILPCIIEEYSDATFILFKQSNMLSLSSLLTV